MFKRAIVLASIFMLCLTAACSSQTATTTGSTSSAASLSQITDSTQLATTEKLGFGILSLDGTPLSITADQAATLLPLWQAVQSLGADKNAASQEIAAVYTQIQESLTADQLAHIEQLALTQEELTSMLQKYQSQSSLTSSTTKTTTAATTPSQGQNMGGGPGGDMPPDGGILMGGGTGMEMAAVQSTTGETQQSLILSQTSTKSTVEINVLFANAVIILLQKQLAI